MLGGGRDVLALGDRLGKGELEAPGLDRPARRDRLLHAAERLVETAADETPEAARKGCLRQCIEGADAAQPEALELARRLGRQPQGGNGESRERLALGAGRDDEAIVGGEAGDRPGGPRTRCDRRARGEAAALEPAHEVGQEGRLAAEEMGAAGDVEERAARPTSPLLVDGHPWGVARQPVGKGGKGRAVGRGVGGGDAQARLKRARIRQHLAGSNAGGLGRRVGGDDDEPTARFRGGREGLSPPSGERR